MVKPALSSNALKILKKRYLLDHESPEDLFRRVARSVASAERGYGGDPIAYEEEFFNLMTNLEFLPNSPTLMNAGVRSGQLSACFVLPIEDSLESIFDTLKNTVMIHHSGGGVGFNFSKLRPKNDVIKSSGGFASGPVSFLRVFDTATDIVKQGGKRRGANMAVLNYDHPDIIEFIKAKLEGGFQNFNFSVSVTDSFMRRVISDGNYYLINPRNGKRVKRVSARGVFNQIVNCAWSVGEPGLIFIDEINRKHPFKELINATNPCAEQPLLDFESCNLGSINLSKMIINDSINWARLDRVIRLGVRFLDNVIDVTRFPLKEIKEVTLSNRKIGLGVMGFADLLIKLGVPYDSPKALRLADQLMSFINDKAHDESKRLARQRGSFPNLKKSKLRVKHQRNATITTIAPTGTISLIAGCSSSIEPLFAVSFTRQVLDGSLLSEVNPEFERVAREQGFYSSKLMSEVAERGGVQKLKIPSEVKRLFKTALDLKPAVHVKMQAAFQKHVDNAISKTINLPNKAKIKDVAETFLLAYKLKCKGVTVYRYGSRSEQVLTLNCRGGACE